MVHFDLNDGNQWSCGLNYSNTGILLQLDDTTYGREVVVRLDATEAQEIADRLVSLIPKLKNETQSETQKSPCHAGSA